MNKTAVSLNSFNKGLKCRIISLFYDNKNAFTFQKVMLFISAISTLLQIALGSIHSKAIYCVSSTVAIYIFINQIALLLVTVSITRLKEHRKYYLFLGILLMVSFLACIIYINLLYTDIYYLEALAGAYSNEDTIRIIYSISDSVIFLLSAIIINILVVALLISESILKRRKKYGLSYKG